MQALCSQRGSSPWPQHLKMRVWTRCSEVSALLEGFHPPAEMLRGFYGLFFPRLERKRGGNDTPRRAAASPKDGTLLCTHPGWRGHRGWGDPKVAGSTRPQLLEEFCRSTSGIATGEPETGAKSLILPLSSFGQLWSLLNIHSAARTGSVQHLVQCD